MKIKCLAAGVLFLAAASASAAEWRPKERWRGFNLEGYGLMGTFSGRIEEDDMRWIRAFGFNFVRLMVDYRFIRSDADGTKPDAAKCGFLDNVLAMGRRHGLHVNLCLSIPPGIDYKVTRSKAVLFDDPKAGRTLADYWRFLARRYRGIPNDDLTFNLFNEPNTAPKDDEYVRLIARCLNAIREEDPARFVIADGLDNGRRPEPGACVFRNLGQSLHMYEPMCVSHYGASWCGGMLGEPCWPPQPFLTPLFGTYKPADARHAAVIRRVPACRLAFERLYVNRLAELYVRADGRELLRRRFAPAPDGDWTNLVARTGGQWAGRLVCDPALDVPACDTLEIGVGEGDWADFKRLVITATDGRSAAVTPAFDYTRAQKPRAAAWFAGFEDAPLASGAASLAPNPGPLALDAAGTRPDGMRYLLENILPRWTCVEASDRLVMVGEFGFYNKTPHAVGLAWMEDNLRLWKARGWGWALWNFRGPFGILDSGRKDVAYEDFHGHKLDRKMLDLLQKY